MVRAAVLVAIGLAGLLGGATPAWPASADSATAVLSTDVAGAPAVGLTLRLGYPMQCGSPGPGPVSVTLPAAMTVPQSIARAAVLVDGKPAVHVARNGRAIVVGLAQPTGIMCDVIAPGTLTIRFRSTVGLGNPRVPGTYVVRAATESRSFAARVVIHPR